MHYCSVNPLKRWRYLHRNVETGNLFGEAHSSQGGQSCCFSIQTLEQKYQPLLRHLGLITAVILGGMEVSVGKRFYGASHPRVLGCILGKFQCLSTLSIVCGLVQGYCFKLRCVTKKKQIHTNGVCF